MKKLAKFASLVSRLLLAAVLCVTVSTAYGQHHRRSAHRSAAAAVHRPAQNDSYSREEIDGKLSDLDASVGARLDAASQTMGARLDALEKKQSAQWWIPAVAAAVFSAIFTLLFKTISDRRQARKAALETSMDFVSQFSDDDWETAIGDAMDDLTSPERLKNPDSFKRIVHVGNWFEELARAWRGNQLDTEYIKRNDLHNHAKAFWSKLEEARRACEADTTNPRSVDIARLQKDFWKNLQWLATHVT